MIPAIGPRHMALLLLAGCAFVCPRSTALGSSPTLGPDTAVPVPVTINVPFVRQPKDGCGSASIAMVMQYWAAQQGAAPGTDSDVNAIQSQLHAPHQKGIAAEQMEAYLRQHGFRVFPLNGNWSDLEEQVGKGRPVIAALRPAGPNELHYVVIAGIDDAHGMVTINDPAVRKLLTRERAGFEQEWKATHNWLLLAVPAAAK
jgi:ABC-type bacteriocin/lantibiotic exporter with double-glycine peptidase domain